MSDAFVEALRALVERRELTLPDGVPGSVTIERPRQEGHGDYASNVALQLAKKAGTNPRAFAELIAEELGQADGIAAIEVAGPGFLNVTVEASSQGRVAADIVAAGPAYGTSNALAGERINVEFISANPTGPLHLGHTRWAAVGDALARVLEAAGAVVSREFYINDRGTQMDLFGDSILARALGEEPPAYGYQGEYVHELAAQVVAENPGILELPDDERRLAFREEGYRIQLANQQAELAEFHTVFDTWFSERDLHGVVPTSSTSGAGSSTGDRDGFETVASATSSTIGAGSSTGDRDGFETVASATSSTIGAGFSTSDRDGFETVASATSSTSGASSSTSDRDSSTSDLSPNVAETLEKLRGEGHLYDADRALWMRTTDFGDDKDRVLIRSNGELTYFASDTAYYLDKRVRGFDRCIYLLGADHHGYVGRLRAMAACAGDDPDTNIEVLIGQLVKILENGQELKLSKRAGNIVSLRELIDLIGVDALRYTLARYPADSPLTLDAAEMTRQASDNPVFYVQYAHARVSSILRNAGDLGFDTVASATSSTSELTHPREGELLRALAEFPRVVQGAAVLREPHRVARYLEDTAAAYHRFYDSCRVLPQGDEEPNDLHRARLMLVDATRVVLANGLALLGVSAPERM
nr:arginine--tRNA ligase [Nocardioides agariphilus]